MSIFTQNTVKQRGFFDLGLALVILAIGSTAGVVHTKLHEADQENQKLVLQVQELQNSQVSHAP